MESKTRTMLLEETEDVAGALKTLATELLDDARVGVPISNEALATLLEITEELAALKRASSDAPLLEAADARTEKLDYDMTKGCWTLGKEPLRAGQLLEVELQGGAWVPLRFELIAGEDRPESFFVLSLSKGDAVVRLPPGARVRTYEGVSR